MHVVGWGRQEGKKEREKKKADDEMGREWSKSEREKIPATNQKKNRWRGWRGGGGATPKKKVTLLHSLHAPIRNTGRAQLPALRMSSASSARSFLFNFGFLFLFSTLFFLWLVFAGRLLYLSFLYIAP